VLSYVSVEGGPVHDVPTPFVRVLPEAISPDGERLLAGSGSTLLAMASIQHGI
jgi:hypothetical protein